MSNKVILGLDISTATIGVCLMAVDGDDTKILEITHISPKISSKIKGVEGLFMKMKIFEDEFINKYKNMGITDVVIEEPLMGSNNIRTVAILLKFSVLISSVIYKELGIVPEYISSYESRLCSFPELLAVRKYNKKGEMYPVSHIKKSIKNNELTLFGSYAWDVEKKHVMHGLINDKFKGINWIYDKNGELKKENFDASDATVCCLAYANKIKNGEVEAKITNVVENETSIEYDAKVWGNTYKHRIDLI